MSAASGFVVLPADSDRFNGAPSQCVNPVLLDPCAAALDQDNQHNQKQHTGNNPDNQGTVHVKSPFLRKQVNDSQILIGFGSRLALKQDQGRRLPKAHTSS
jgi:hypothetical protein